VRAVGIDAGRVVAVVQPIVVEHMREAVPFRAGLEVEEHRVVGVAGARRHRKQLDVIAAGGGHRVHGVDTSCTGHRPLAVHGDLQRKRDTPADELGGGCSLGGGDEVQRADLVFGAPSTPVAHSVAERGDFANQLVRVERGKRSRRIHVKPPVRPLPVAHAK
jgi:hypothetical protein